MRVIGIIAEYNPFHKGHEYLIKQARERVGDPRAIVMSIMSGPFTQRGLPAMAPKHIRAKQALVCGSDVVLELPFEWACAPASEFAYGAVKTLVETGVVTDIAWGIEEDSADLVEALADPAIYSDERYIAELKSSLEAGASFPAANANAVTAVAGGDEERIRTALRSPNTILAVEYLKAVRATGAKFKVHMITRRGQGYSDDDHTSGQEFHSASAIRKAITCSSGTMSGIASAVSGKMPDKAAAVMLSSISRGEFTPSDLDAYAARVITAPAGDISGIRFMNDGLAGYIGNVLGGLRAGETSFEALSAKLATRHFTMPRIYRALTMMLLGIREGDVAKDPAYIRILGFNHDGRYCLKIMGRCASLPVIHNLSDMLEHKELGSTMKICAAADDLAASLTGAVPFSCWNEPPVAVR